MIGFVLALVVFFGLAVFLRAAASRENPTFVTFVPAQMHALVTTKSSKVTDATKGGGNVVNVIHAIPGKRLDKSPVDPMNWHYKDGKEPRGLLYYLLGIQFIWLFRYLRLNDVRTFRFGRKDVESKYSIMAKSQQTRYVFFSGQHDVQVESAETVGILKVNLLFNLIYEETYPVRVRLRTADPYAVLTMMVTRLVISKVGGTDPKLLIAEEARQQELARAIQAIAPVVEEQLGIKIKKVTLADVAFDTSTQELLELEIRTRLNNEAAVAIAEKDKSIQILANDADADRVERVIIPAARDERTVAVRVAEAYERNKVVTTYAPGASTMIPLAK
ncbi:MAG: hypothetical protein A2665_01770 [Candidatus Zambryskibacteria bacterium RIFCSPHIGHO2_01_FULL_46_30]|uniref:Band 7 domain-containing protein n=1 Tax=Candidatus Zambryskibacteria bacterium RIFCSPHIGHO2_01_FULL_46_30 TaxID=1802739 RepID=A0A1G2T5I3_9BACT|nr:MAG: hypothetical protein A2665_01770 [Candidatus Zambryskibacteria bacterium RIFCSPHIGHO2_01_FULL_46_30]OHB06340.1 MAG: hypothetical protein A3B22_02140 [Candidatus Zambryskibacteria bacterium RIFCSPLOWO2_01_FULL_47_33]